jgi:hypothetical protein
VYTVQLNIHTSPACFNFTTSTQAKDIFFAVFCFLPESGHPTPQPLIELRSFTGFYERICRVLRAMRMAPRALLKQAEYCLVSRGLNGPNS